MRAGHKSKGHRKCPLHDLTLTCRIFLSRIIKIAPFFIDNKGRTAINPNIFIYVLNGIIGLFTGWRSVFDVEINVQKVVLAGILHSLLF